MRRFHSEFLDPLSSFSVGYKSKSNNANDSKKASFGRHGSPLPVELASWAFGDALPRGCCRGGPAVAGFGGAEEVAAGGPGQLPGPETGIQGPEDRLCQRR